jgi:hypothetical protein
MMNDGKIKTLPRNLELYYLNRHRMGTGDIIEFRSNTLVGWGIRKFTGYSVNHTALVIRLGQYDPNRVFVLEALEHGVVLNLLSRRLAAFDGRAWWLGLKPEYGFHRMDIGRIALGHVGVKYDFGSILRQLVARVSVDARAFFCSEYAYLPLLEAGLPVRRETAPWPGEMLDLGVYLRPRRVF